MARDRSIEPGRVRQSEMNTESLAVLIKQVKQEVYKNSQNLLIQRTQFAAPTPPSGEFHFSAKLCAQPGVKKTQIVPT
jgi:phosphatidylethanolamine-binding protein (PEBP) family uncharacterized protein